VCGVEVGEDVVNVHGTCPFIKDFNCSPGIQEIFPAERCMVVAHRTRSCVEPGPGNRIGKLGGLTCIRELHY
jgi:hypothetical protein